MSTDYPDPQPVAEPTDPGFKQHNAKVGAHEEFTLPDVTPIINPLHTSSVGRFANEFWVRMNWLFRGIAGTSVDWFVFFAEIGKAYPRQTALVAAFIIIPLEEKYSDNPYISNTFQYCLEVIDPAAAEKIFRPKVIAEDPVGDASKKLLTEATSSFLKGPEYAELKLEVEQDVQRQVRKTTYLAAGMKEDAAAVEAEIIAACALRKEKRAPTAVALPEPEPVAPVETPPPEAVEPVSEEHPIPVEPL